MRSQVEEGTELRYVWIRSVCNEFNEAEHVGSSADQTTPVDESEVLILDNVNAYEDIEERL